MIPGEFIGTEEEFLPGKGTYVGGDGKIIGTVIGELHIDSKHRATVIPKEKLPEIKDLIAKGIVHEKDFFYEKYNGAEIIP